MYQQTIDHHGSSRTTGGAYLFVQKAWKPVFMLLEEALLSMWEREHPLDQKPSSTFYLRDAIISSAKETRILTGRRHEEYHIRIKLFQRREAVLTLGFRNEEESLAWLAAFAAAAEPIARSRSHTPTRVATRSTTPNRSVHSYRVSRGSENLLASNELLDSH